MKMHGKWLVVLLLFTVFALGVSGCDSLTGTNGTSGTSGTSGSQAVGITKASVNDAGHLMITLSNGQTIDAGNVVTGGGAGGKASFADLVPVVEPTIVRVDVTVRNGLASGSGTIFDKRGYIMTNNHVVTGGQSIKVTLKDNTTFSASVVAADSKQDLAIIKLDTARTDFPTMQMGTMADIKVGETVMAMGFPGGPNIPGPATFTAGIVSAIRNLGDLNFVQTDTPVNPGNSGGCLFTLSGKMIGIPTEGLTPANQDFEEINLAIPIDRITAFIRQNIQ